MRMASFFTCAQQKVLRQFHTIDHQQPERFFTAPQKWTIFLYKYLYKSQLDFVYVQLMNNHFICAHNVNREKLQRSILCK